MTPTIQLGEAIVTGTIAGTIADAVSLFVGPDQVTELRALHVGQKGRTFAGWFDGRHLFDLARHALALSREAAGVYFVPNPINPALLDRRPNTVGNVYRGRPDLTRDVDVPARHYLLVDIDPTRHSVPISERTPSRVYRSTKASADQPTTARELFAARLLARTVVVPTLRQHGFADPITMLSGNGIHLVYRLLAPLPGGICGSNDPLAAVLRKLADQVDSDLLTIDTNTYTSARMLKVPGTWTRKGEASPLRPYRRARILETPNGWVGSGPAEGSGELSRAGLVA